ncbi:MAG TPA: MGMT family protein [Anaeromyxobacteraceae bacterium]|nr:MGMT family protein [Anaeromyxobacteraceae bacterium]
MKGKAAFPVGWEAFYRVVRRIPRGRVATYGEVALLAGRPRGARQVGYALAALRGGRHRVPWQRVLGARAGGMAAVSILDAVGAAAQRHLLEREGVGFDERGRVSLARFGLGARPASLSRWGSGSPSRSPRRTAGSSGRRRSARSGPR